ncbi:MAG: MarP family serine protease [Candidatus Saccharimonadia bacterium]
MNWLDIIIFVVFLIAVARGLRAGLAVQVFSLLGFFAGLFLGSLIVPSLINYGHSTLSRSLITLVITLGAAVLFSSIGELFGHFLHSTAVELHLGSFDGFLGGLFEVVAVIVAVWLIAAPLNNLQAFGISGEIHSSRIIYAINQLFPPAPDILARLEHYIEPNGFPTVFLGNYPNPTPQQLPSNSQIQPAITEDEASVVKIEGIGCGGLVEGSGFVVGNGYVATNAHVIAGILHPRIIDGNGLHATTVVLFDPTLDFAVLQTSDLAGAPLQISSKLAASGAAAAVLGYPGGGPFSAVAASVLDETKAIGRNIYGSGLSSRDIYEIEAIVEPGNSGGPLLATDGSVIGVVFAKADNNNAIGYALTSAEIISRVVQAKNQVTPVSTGMCTSS